VYFRQHRGHCTNLFELRINSLSMEVCVDSVESAVNAFRGGKTTSNVCCTLGGYGNFCG